MSNGQLLSLIANPLVPDNREAAIKELKSSAVLSEQAAAALSEALSAPEYNHRNCGKRLARAQDIVDAYVDTHMWCPVNPYRTIAHLRALVSFIPERFSLGRLSGSTIVEYGAGAFNTFSRAVLLYANGVQRVICIEPAKINVKLASKSAQRVMQAIIMDPGRFNISGLPNAELKRRVSELDFEDLFNNAGKVDFYATLGEVGLDGEVDSVMSTSVLEHVLSLSEEMALQKKALRSNGVLLHSVDFTEHRRPKGHLFRFYFDGELHTVNGLRVSEMEAVFAGAGLSSRRVDEASHQKPLNREKMTERFRYMSDEDLRTKSAVFLMQ